jgi:signal transduction histidine kinase
MHTYEKQFYTAVTIAATVLGMIIVVFTITMIRHQRRYFHLHKVKIRAEISALEQERTRIANDLHDELGPLLSAVRIQINCLSQSTEADRNIVVTASKYIDDVLTRARAISYNLLPTTLVRKGLIPAVQEYIKKLSANQLLRISLEGEKSIDLPKEMSIHIYRIIQEIIHNVIKHSGASRLVISLNVKDHKLNMRTADDGVGFHYEQKIEACTGFGLLGLESRAEILNAQFNYQSKPGHGTQYSFEIPMNQQSYGTEKQSSG